MSELIYRMVSSTAAVFLGTFGAYYLIYRSGKKKTKGAFEKLGIDPKDVTYITYINIGANRFYPEDYYHDEKVQNSVENAKNKYHIRDIREMKLGNLLKNLKNQTTRILL